MESSIQLLNLNVYNVYDTYTIGTAVAGNITQYII